MLQPRSVEQHRLPVVGKLVAVQLLGVLVHMVVVIIGVPMPTGAAGAEGLHRHGRCAVVGLELGIADVDADGDGEHYTVARDTGPTKYGVEGASASNRLLYYTIPPSDLLSLWPDLASFCVFLSRFFL